MVTKHFVHIGVLALIGGCGAMQYTPKTESKGGYSHTQLAPGVFDVHYSGSGRFDGERISDFLLLRAAELCLGAGFDYFEISHNVSTVVPAASSGQPFLNLPPATDHARANCFNHAVDGAERFSTAFIVDKLRAKYALPG